MGDVAVRVGRWPRVTGAATWSGRGGPARVHLSPDRVHADDAGYRTLAQRWYAALLTAGLLAPPR